MSIDTQDIFSSPLTDLRHIDPANIRLLSDRVLIEDLGEDERQGSVIIPETAASRGVGKGGLLRLGVVIAVGPGDRYEERRQANGEALLDRDGLPVLKRLTSVCSFCGGVGGKFDIVAYERVPCPRCHGEKREGVTVPAQVVPGDRVIYDRRREAEFVFYGRRYSMINAEQSVMAVVQDGPNWVCTWCAAPSHKPAKDELVTCPKCGIHGCKPLPQVRPLYDRILVLRREPVKQVGLLYIPDSAQEANPRGIVVGVGPGILLKGMDVQVGDEVMFGFHQGSDIELAGKKYLLSRERLVLGVIEKERKPC